MLSLEKEISKNKTMNSEENKENRGNNFMNETQNNNNKGKCKKCEVLIITNGELLQKFKRMKLMNTKAH
jgi:hypothetical protein